MFLATADLLDKHVKAAETGDAVSLAIVFTG
jgi:hypothetical protein